MKKHIAILALGIFITGCASDYDRLADAQKKYPHCIVTPSTQLLSNQGYELTVEDTITGQIYAVSYYIGSTTKIQSVRNIR